jgi:hypothetical protein
MLGMGGSARVDVDRGKDYRGTEARKASTPARLCALERISMGSNGRMPAACAFMVDDLGFVKPHEQLIQPLLLEGGKPCGDD